MGAGTSAHRKTRATYLGEISKLLARFAMGALDGEHHGPRVIPTMLSTASYVGNALSPYEPEEVEGVEYPAGVGMGATIDELFELTAQRIEVGNVAAIELLGSYYLRIAALLLPTSGKLDAKQIETVVQILVRDIDAADADGEVSLWCRYMQAVWPASAQTPGSPKWNAAGPNANRESQANPFAPWLKVRWTW